MKNTPIKVVFHEFHHLLIWPLTMRTMNMDPEISLYHIKNTQNNNTHAEECCVYSIIVMKPKKYSKVTKEK